MTSRHHAEQGAELIDPFECRMWACHDRLEEFLTEESCREVIDSFLKEGQKIPVLARPIKSPDGVKYELIYGARRLFSARHLNLKLLARVRDLDDHGAFIEMDVENRLRSDISAYERGLSFRSWLREGHFQSQEEIAKTLGLSKAHVCRLMKFSELPAAVVAAFPDPRQIKEAWAVDLAERCADAEMRNVVLSAAKVLRHQNGGLESKQIYKALIEGRRCVSRISLKDLIVRSAEGRTLFRISYRHNDLHVIMRRDVAPPHTMESLVKLIKQVLEVPNVNGHRTDVGPTPGGGQGRQPFSQHR